jgi:hypothetical protein
VAGGLNEIKAKLAKLEKGGVLFIDEAYQLDPAKNPMGAQVGRSAQHPIALSSVTPRPAFCCTPAVSIKPGSPAACVTAVQFP